MTGFIFTLDKKDDWHDPANWVKSNPNLEVSVSLKYLNNEFTDAINKGGHRLVNFLTKNLNMWVDAEDVWVPDDVWMENADPVNENELIGRPCFLGLDLSEKYDITALARYFPPAGKDNKRKCLGLFYAYLLRYRFICLITAFYIHFGDIVTGKQIGRASVR